MIQGNTLSESRIFPSPGCSEVAVVDYKQLNCTELCVNLLFSTLPPPQLAPLVGPSASPAQHKVYTASIWLCILAGAVCAHRCVYERMCMRASQCVLVGAPTHGTLDSRYISFQRKRKQRLQMIHGSSMGPARVLSPPYRFLLSR